MSESAGQSISFRRAQREDVREIVRMLADDHLGSQRERFEEPIPESYYRAFEAIDADPHQELVVAETGGAVVGTLQITYIHNLSYQGGLRAHVEGVRVDSAHRGHQIGGKLLEWAITRAREEGCHMVQLTTNKSRPDAVRFYERLGFVASHVGMKLEI